MCIIVCLINALGFCLNEHNLLSIRTSIYAERDKNIYNYVFFIGENVVRFNVLQWNSSRNEASLPECTPVMKRPIMTMAGILQALLKPIRAPPIKTSTVALTRVPFLRGHTAILNTHRGYLLNPQHTLTFRSW